MCVTLVQVLARDSSDARLLRELCQQWGIRIWEEDPHEYNVLPTLKRLAQYILDTEGGDGLQT